MTDLSPNSNKCALAALRERRAELSGEIVQLESRLRSLRQSLEHLDGTLPLFDPGVDPSTIPDKKPYRRSKLFGAGKLNRTILGALRKADKPLSSLEVTQAVCDDLGWGDEALKGMRQRVRSNLLYLAQVRGLVVRTGARESSRWELKG